jgi:hypothetical protein
LRGLAVGEAVEVVARRHRNLLARLHAARKRKCGHETGNLGANASHRETHRQILDSD